MDNNNPTENSTMDNATVTIAPNSDTVRIQVTAADQEQTPDDPAIVVTSAMSPALSEEPEILSPPPIDILPMSTGFTRFRYLFRRELFNPMQRRFNTITETRSLGLHQHKYTDRELAFLTIDIMLTIVAIVLIATVGVNHSTIFANLIAGKNGQNVICLDYNCYKSSALMQRRMNTSVSPCDNFYQYACGGWIASQILSADEQERTVVTTIMNENVHRLKDVLLEELDQYRDTHWAYEKKVQTYYKTCVDQYQSTLLSIIANPLLDEINKMGGWYVLDDTYLSRFNHTEAHASVLGHDHLVDVFFFFDVEPLDQQHQYHFITIREDLQLPLPYNLWSRTELTKAYKKAIRSVGELLAKDFDVTDANLTRRLDTFVSDVVEVERALARIQRSNSAEIVNPRPIIRTISQLRRIAPAFRWLYFFQTVFFPEAEPSKVNLLTQVIVKTPTILTGVSDYLVKLAADPDMKRKLNNYLVWRLSYAQLPEMPYRYNHIWLDWSEKVRGRSFYYEPIWVICFQQVAMRMSDALGGLFARRHFNHYNKYELNLMAEATRTSVIKEVQNLPWMDDPTKGNATEKLYHLVEKIGFPDHMDTELYMQNALDFLYMEVEMSDVDHFANALQLRQHFRKQMIQIFNDGRDPYSDWRETPLYSTKLTYFYPWNEVIVPAGLLQFPIYSAINPTMFRVQTFGATAVRLARPYILAINEIGSWFDKFGDFPDDWWTNSTHNNYRKLKKCINDVYAKVETKPIASSGEPLPMKLDYPDFYAIKSIADIGALRNAFVAYKSEDVQSDPITRDEPMIPGVQANSRDEYFFLSFVQSNCAARTDERTAENMENSFWLPEELAINTALSQLKEFSDVFQCPAGSRMHPTTRCSAIF